MPHRTSGPPAWLTHIQTAHAWRERGSTPRNPPVSDPAGHTRRQPSHESPLLPRRKLASKTGWERAPRGQDIPKVAELKNVYILALAAYFLFSVCDASIKAAGGGSLSVFEIGFIVNMAAAAVLLTTRHPGERWRDFWITGRPLAIHARAFFGLVGSLCAIYAFTTIPLAQAYALIFLSPIFVTILSGLVLKETIGLWRWSAVALGFLGVLLVLRPGMQALQPGHLAAMLGGISTGFSVIILRQIGTEAKRTSILGMLLLYLLCLNGIVALVIGIRLPTPTQFLHLLMAGAAYGLGQWALIMAARRGNASQIVPMQYSQLIWAVTFGAAFFAEYPDGIAIAGLAVVGSSGLLTLVRELILQRRQHR